MDVEVTVHRADGRGNVYTLRRDLHYGKLTVPAGFESDGASVPRFFWRLVFPPGDSRALCAAIIHDYVYRQHPGGWSKKLADRVFFILLRKGGIVPFAARLAYWGVRLFGRSSWKDGRYNE